jgi:hypothetical protein
VCTGLGAGGLRGPAQGTVLGLGRWASQGQQSKSKGWTAGKAKAGACPLGAGRGFAPLRASAPVGRGPGGGWRGRGAKGTIKGGSMGAQAFDSPLCHSEFD